MILPIVYKFTLTFTVDFLHLFNPISNIFLLILNLLFLILPYFLAGTSLVLIFSLYSKEIESSTSSIWPVPPWAVGHRP